MKNPLKSLFSVKTDLKALDQVLDKLNQLETSEIPKKDWLQCQLALAEGFTNAVRHAHANLPSETPIQIELSLQAENLLIRIWDQGDYFDLQGFIKEHEGQNRPFSGRGQGLIILQKIARYLSYYRTANQQNCLLIVKQFTSEKSMTDIGSVVSPQWLLSQLDNPDVIVVDCRFQLNNPDWGHQEYLKGHIPGAAYLNLDQDLSRPVTRHGGRHPLPDPNILGAKLAALGITKGKTRVIAYDSSRFAFAARLWWLLRYLGHDQVSVLDGGWLGWCDEDYPTTRDQGVTPSPGEFNPDIRQDWIVDIETVKIRKEQPSVILVDSRSGDRYRGEREPIDPVAGHIPGAVNAFWQNATNDQGYLRSLAEIEQIWQPYNPAEELIVYCGSGVTACVNLLSLELIGNHRGRLYPGGWSDWCSY